MAEALNKIDQKGRKVFLLICLILVFVGPIIFAWWFIESGQAKSMLRNNHGLLIEPSVDLREFDSLVFLKEITLTPGEWAAVYFSEGDCAESCKEALRKLGLVRSLLGRDGPRLYVWGLQGSGDSKDEGPRIVNKKLVEGLILVLQNRLGPLPSLSKGEGVIVFDWRSQLMMYYPDFKSSGLKKDLSKLLRASRIR